MKTNEKTYTAADMRAAIIEGGTFVLGNSGRITDPSTPTALRNIALLRYPDPKTPRVVRDTNGRSYRLLNGELQFLEGREWMTSVYSEPLKLFADLLDNPYEESSL